MFFKHGNKAGSLSKNIAKIQKALTIIKLSPAHLAENNVNISNINAELEQLGQLKFSFEQKRLAAERPLKDYQKQISTIQEFLRNNKEKLNVSDELYSEKIAEIQTIEDQLKIITENQQEPGAIDADININELNKLIHEYHLDESNEDAQQYAIEKVIYAFHRSEGLASLNELNHNPNYLKIKKSVDNKIEDLSAKIKDVEDKITHLESLKAHFSIDFVKRGILIENIITQCQYNFKIKGFNKLDKKLTNQSMHEQIKSHIENESTELRNKTQKSAKVVLDTIDNYSLERAIDAGIIYTTALLFDPQNLRGKELAIAECIVCRWTKKPDTNDIMPPNWCNFTLEEFQQLVYDTCCHVLVNGLDKKAVQELSLTTNKPAQLVNNGYGQLLANELNVTAWQESTQKKEGSLDTGQPLNDNHKSFKR